MSRPIPRRRWLVAATLALTLPAGMLEAAPALANQVRAHSSRSSATLPGPVPVQRSGSAAGRPHLVGTGGNHVVPTSLRSRYPLTLPATGAATGRNTAEVVAPAPGDPAGYRPGTSVERPALRDEFSRTYANADGSSTTVLSTVAVNHRAADGSWQPIRPRLTATPDGLVSVGGAQPLRLTGRLGSPTTATLTLDADHRIGWTALGARPVAARVVGATASYAGYLPGTDLELTGQAGGVKEVLVLHDAHTPTDFGFALGLTHLTARLAGDQVNLLDATGTVRAVIPAGSMTDAAGASSDAVRYRLAGDVLRVGVDRSWLRDPRRVFPVRVDPTVLASAAGTALTVQDGAAYTGSSDFQVGVRGGVRSAAYLAFPGVSTQLANETIYAAKLSVVDYDAGSCSPRSAGVYPVTQAWAATDTTLRYPGPSVGAALAAKSYGYGYVALGQHGTSCPVTSTLYDLGAAGRDLVQGWANGGPNYGLSVRASGTDPAAWKRFTGTGTANPPQLYITHSPYNADYLIPKPVLNPPVLQNQDGQINVVVTNRGAFTWTPSTYYLAYRVTDSTGKVVAQQKAASLSGNVARNARVTLAATVKAMPAGRYTLDFTMVHVGGPTFTDDWVPPARLVLQVYNIPPVPQAVYPPNGYQAPTLTPQLWASAVDKDAPSSTLTYNFSICPAGGTCWTSGYQSSSAWTVPAGDLVWNRSYSWHADVKDTNGAVTPTPTITVLTPVPQPDVTGHLGGAPYASQGMDFDPLTGNYTTGAVDASIATAGPSLNAARTYNSLDPRTDQAFGAGWSSVYDMKLVTEPDGSGNVLLTLSDGQQVRFGKNPDGSYTGPSDRSSQLTLAGGIWTLRDHTGSSFTFAGTGKLTKIQGPWGQPIVLTYDTNGKLAKATSQVSGRYLSFTWTGAHLSSVATNPVNGVSPTWTYSYLGDQLSSVCAPGSTCTGYAASTGSHYRSAVLDSNPDSYWRLGEPAGTTAAASQVAINLGADAAGYTAVTLGGTGALAGTADTSAAFDGLSSYVGLPNGIAKRSRDMAVELWFKTTAIQANPLLGYQDKAFSSVPGTGVPMLYLGTDGKLRGQLAAGVRTPITSAAAVNDGKWHHVVLSAAGGVQTLYLDGVSVGTLTAAVNQTTLTYAQVGAAYATGTWTGYGSAPRTYFNGSIDEVAVYSHPLGSDTVATHRRLGTVAASQLSRITLPSGRVGAAVSYDTDYDRIGEYTDADGGTWHLDPPQTGGGDNDLRMTVAVRDPADRPYEYEYDALGGWLLRAGTPAGVSVRPEDQAGAPGSPSPPPGPTCTTAAPGDPTFCVWDTSTAPATTVFDTQGMAVRSYSYDSSGELTTAVDENGDTVTMTYDALGNVATRTSCRTSATDCGTTRYSYPTGLTDPLDPRWYEPTEIRDPRSASATDTTYRTTFSYTAKGDLAGQVNPDSSSTHEYYTNGSEGAVGGGTLPAGLLLKSVDELGSTTSYGYYSTGDLAQITQPSGLLVKYGYDALGRLASQTEVSDTFPAGVVTSYGYDDQSRLVSTTYPTTTDLVTGARHQRRTTVSYDADGHPLTSTDSDLLGGDPARQSSFGYDEHGLLETSTDAAGGQLSYEHDRFGNVTAKIDENGNRWEYAYTARNAIAEVRLRDADSTGDGGYAVLSSTAYDYAGRPVQQTDAAGRTTVVDYFHDGLVKSRTLQKFHNSDGSTRDLVLEQDSYDAAGNLTKLVTGNGSRTTSYQRDTMGRVKSSTDDPSGVARITSYSYDLAGNVLQQSTTGNSANLLWPSVVQTGTVSFGYDAAGRPTSRRTTLASGSTAVTTTSYDQRGFAVAVVDPRGNLTGATASAFTTNYGYDELGQPTSVTSPPVSAEQNQQSPATVRPQVRTGYDTFGEPTSVMDALGNVSSNGYDLLGRMVRSTAPAYTPPGAGAPITPTRTAGYDPLGNLTSTVDPGGHTTRFSYDRLNHLITVDAPAADDITRAVSRFSYAHTGSLLSSTDPTGAVTRYTYDDLDRPATVTRVERTPQPANLTSTMAYDDAGDLTGITSATGATSTAGYDTDGQLTSTTDPNGVVTRYGYDSVGDQARSSDGLGRTTKLGYDAAGRLTSATSLDPMGSPLRSVSLGYDVAGNQTTVTDPLGAIATTSYDSLDRVLGRTQQVSAGNTISTGYGYDAAGNRTRYTDGLGNATYYTVNSLGLPESVVEPATTAHPATADRTWTAAYNALGQPVTLTEPGGVQVRNGYDAAGRLTSQTGSGAESPDASRSLGYDLAGRLTSVNAPAGTDGYGYDDRGLLLSATGPSGAASFGYDGDGNLIQRTDPSGSATFGYTRGRLTSQTDPVTGQSQTLTYDGAGAVRTIGYGAGLTRTFGYDSLGRLSTDVLTNAAGSQVTSTGYGYDLADRVTSRTTAGVAGAGASSYGYDLAGRMTSWTSGSSTTNYTWDADGNRTQAGSRTATYDQRNRLITDGSTSYSYAPRGTLATQTGPAGTEQYAFDAFDRMVGDGSQGYTYDGLDRLASQAGTALLYSGTGTAVVADRSQVFGRSPGGSLLSVGQGSTQRAVLTDQHGDVTAGFDPANGSQSAVPDSRSYDPWGNVTASAGTSYHVGYQGALTDPSTGKVNMNARWYSPASGSFTARDSVDNSDQSAAAANKYSYAAGDPVSLVDPSGHGACPGSQSGSGPDPRLMMFTASLSSGCEPSSGGGSGGSGGDEPAMDWPSLLDGLLGGGSGSGGGSGGSGGGSGGDGSGSGSGSGSGPSAAELLHQRQVAAQQQAKQAISRQAKTVRLPTPAAATRPGGQGAVVSSSANLPARVVSQTSNGVRDNRAGTQRVYQHAVDQAGQVSQQASPVSSTPSCGGSQPGGYGTRPIPNYHPDPNNPGNAAAPLDLGGNPCGGGPSGPGGSSGSGGGSSGSGGGKNKPLTPGFPHLNPEQLTQAEQQCKQGHDVFACHNFYWQTDCGRLWNPSFPGNDDQINVCLQNDSKPYLPAVHGDPLHHGGLPGSSGGGGGGGFNPLPDWLLTVLGVAAGIAITAALIAVCVELCTAAVLGGAAAGAGEAAESGGLLARIWAGLKGMKGASGGWLSGLGQLVKDVPVGLSPQAIQALRWLYNHGGPYLQRIRDGSGPVIKRLRDFFGD